MAPLPHRITQNSIARQQRDKRQNKTTEMWVKSYRKLRRQQMSDDGFDMIPLWLTMTIMYDIIQNKYALEYTPQNGIL